MKLLEHLYKTHSPSHHEEKMASLIKQYLTKWGVKYKQDEHLQIYSIIPETPLFVAHMDQVQKNPCEKVMTFKNQIWGFDEAGKKTGLGADDKNGVWIILKLLESKHKISFIFSAAEEAGGKLGKLIPSLDLSKTSYGLIFDRRGKADIIGTRNSYCEDDLQTAIQTIAGDYSPASGIFSDGDELSNHIPCVNLSVGYYNAHTVDEYTSIPELKRALELAKDLVRELPYQGKPFALPTKLARGNWGWSRWGDEIDYSKGNDPRYDEKDLRPESYSKPGKHVKSIEDCELLIEADGRVIFIDENWLEYTIADNPESACGIWTVGTKSKPRDLNIEIWDQDNDLYAEIDSIPIEVTDMRR